MPRLGFHDDGDRARADDDAYRQDWAEAHGYIPRTERPPLPPAHLCPAQYGYLVHGSRAGCPHCKIAAPASESSVKQPC